MNTITINNEEVEYAVGDRWKNMERNVEFVITEISENLISVDDGLKKLSSIDHINRTLFCRMASEGDYQKLS